MNSLCTAVVHSEHRVPWKHIDLNQSVCAGRGGILVSSLQQTAGTVHQ